MFQDHSKFFLAALCLLFLPFTLSSPAAAQGGKAAAATDSSSSDPASTSSDPNRPDYVPQPGEMGSPFPANHFWNHFALELSGGYSPVVGKGQGYLNQGFNVTAGVVDHLSPHWNLLAEAQFLGLEGTPPISNTDFVLDFGGSYDLLGRSITSPYLIGSVGYYELGAYSPSCNELDCLGPTLAAASAVGYNGGLGVRRRLYAGKRMEIFAEGRYHYIASGSSDFGQISLLPISAGIRW